MKKNFKCVFAVVNNGYSEVAMDAAKASGAKGGTILRARGSVSKEAEKFFNVSIQPEKEIVMILAENSLVDNILKSLYNAIGSSTEAQGIAFALPVDEVAGLDVKLQDKKQDKKEDK